MPAASAARQARTTALCRSRSRGNRRGHPGGSGPAPRRSRWPSDGLRKDEPVGVTEDEPDTGIAAHDAATHQQVGGAGCVEQEVGGEWRDGVHDRARKVRRMDEDHRAAFTEAREQLILISGAQVSALIAGQDHDAVSTGVQRACRLGRRRGNVRHRQRRKVAERASRTSRQLRRVIGQLPGRRRPLAGVPQEACPGVETDRIAVLICRTPMCARPLPATSQAGRDRLPPRCRPRSARRGEKPDQVLVNIDAARHHDVVSPAGGSPGRWSRADGEAPGWRGEIRTRSATGRMANRRGGSRSTASPSTPAWTVAGAFTSSRGALHARPGARGLPPGASRTITPSWPLSSAGRVPRASGRSSA
jgi:hypothetical protein